MLSHSLGAFCRTFSCSWAESLKRFFARRFAFISLLNSRPTWNIRIRLTRQMFLEANLRGQSPAHLPSTSYSLAPLQLKHCARYCRRSLTHVRGTHTQVLVEGIRKDCPKSEVVSRHKGGRRTVSGSARERAPSSKKKQKMSIQNEKRRTARVKKTIFHQLRSRGCDYVKGPRAGPGPGDFAPPAPPSGRPCNTNTRPIPTSTTINPTNNETKPLPPSILITTNNKPKPLTPCPPIPPKPSPPKRSSPKLSPQTRSPPTPSPSPPEPSTLPPTPSTLPPTPSQSPSPTPTTTTKTNTKK
ncbi:unnamed protein product [Nesidiocoris tenuis]|uniref:Uncharacterized protein n=1 Tax=Nesidiocoris tenuis TaxID=355587 RepID=A0A6H5GI20_9HEMI|nr:unnamed protein product [Nesidiocoris tenuis]